MTLLAAVIVVALVALVARERSLARGLARRDAAREVVRQGLLRDVRPALDAIVETTRDLGPPAAGAVAIAPEPLTAARRAAQALDDLDVCIDMMWYPRRIAPRAPIDLEHVAADACLRLRCDGLRIHVETAPVRIEAHPGDIGRIVHNLAWEAAARSPQGTPIWVRVAAEHAGAMIAVETTESIADDEKPCLFDGIGKDDRPGGCLRLFVVALLAQANGGRVWVEDRAFGGASFRVLLPHSAGARRAPSFLGWIGLRVRRRPRVPARPAQR